MIRTTSPNVPVALTRPGVLSIKNISRIARALGRSRTTLNIKPSMESRWDGELNRMKRDQRGPKSKRNPIPRRKRPNPMSERRKADNKVYRVASRIFLEVFPCCEVFKKRGLRQLRSVDVHHRRGRAGNLFLDVRFWSAVSREGHHWIERYPMDAKRLGLIETWGQNPRDNFVELLSEMIQTKHWEDYGEYYAMIHEHIDRSPQLEDFFDRLQELKFGT